MAAVLDRSDQADDIVAHGRSTGVLGEYTEDTGAAYVWIDVLPDPDAAHDYLVDLNTKISYPFTILIMALLGIGISASKRKPSLAAGFAQTIFIAFGYLIIVGVTEAFGKNATLPPTIAAWSAPLVFALASVWFLGRANR